MPANRQESRRYIQRSDAFFPELAESRMKDVQALYDSTQIAYPKSILIAGSGTGTEVKACGKLFSDAQIVALDASVHLNQEVIQELGDRVTQAVGLLFHEYIQRVSPGRFDLIVVSTGPSEGITTNREKNALFSRFLQMGQY